MKSKLGSLSLLALTTKLQSHFVFGGSACKQCDFFIFYWQQAKDSKFVNDTSAIERCADPGNKFAWY